MLQFNLSYTYFEERLQIKRITFMVDKITPERRSWTMSRIRSKDTKPERAVRSLLHGLGFRFRKHVKALPGCPDIVLKKHRVVIFVHGCFWHQHRGCASSGVPKSNIEYWRPKLSGNVERDKLHVKNLKREGWRVIIVWECQTKHLWTLGKSLEKRLLPKP
jgi:DNA mismatch endonuclease, patch repair protein